MSINTEPAWYQEMVKANAVNNSVITAPGGPYTLRSDIQPNTITLQCGSEDMLRVTSDGFWVRGVRVPQDDQESQIVYNAFKQWLAWASLNREY
jgi:hypothetical protein